MIYTAAVFARFWQGGGLDDVSDETAKIFGPIRGDDRLSCLALERLTRHARARTFDAAAFRKSNRRRFIPQ